MRAILALLTLAALGAPSATPTTAPTVAAMLGHRRIILIVAPQSQDREVVTQRRILNAWSKQAADRDISVVFVSKTKVTGAADDAATLIKRYALKGRRFQLLLIGKDGHVALRAYWPVAADTLQATIDAMPMRQAGER